MFGFRVEYEGVRFSKITASEMPAVASLPVHILRYCTRKVPSCV